MEPDHSESPSDDPAGRSAAAFERLVCERLDVVMTARGFSAGQGGSSGPVGSVLYCGITGELHEKYPEVVDAPERRSGSATTSSSKVRWPRACRR
jgi:hypothetical protein